MQVFHRRAVHLICVCAFAVAASAAHPFAQAKFTKQDATRFAGKLLQIQKNAETPRKGTALRSTQLTDAEVNAYLRYVAANDVPNGIVDPILRAAGNGRVTGQAFVDLDAVRNQKKRTWTDPLGYLSGRVPVTATGTLTTQNGVGRFVLESATLSSIPVPKSLLQELVSHYSKSADNPTGINMDAPFQLPAAIREIKVGVGTAVVVQ
jgi:hypothetical protein